MTKEQFRLLFRQALDKAVANAEEQVNRPLSRNLIIRLHGAGHRGERVLGVDDAAEALYVDEERFYRIIDVCVVEVCPDRSIVFVRASAHEPAPFEMTWNQPPGSGPFKQLLAPEIKVNEQSS